MQSSKGRTSGRGSPVGAPYTNQDFTAPYLREAVTSSLRRLGTDYIDVLQLHGPAIVQAELFDEISDLVESGKVLRFGIGAESLESARAWISATNIDVVQVPFGVLDPHATDEIFPLASATSVEVWVRGVLGGGLLGGTVAERRAGRVAPSNGDNAAHPKRAFVNELIDLADRVGISPFELAIDYARSFSAISAIVIGVRSHEHLADNIRYMARPLPSADVIAQIEQTIARWVADRELT